MISYRGSAKFDQSATVILLSQEQVKKKSFPFDNKIIFKQIVSVIEAKQFFADNAQIFPIVHNKKILLLVGVGMSKNLSLTTLRITVRKAILSSYLSQKKDIELIAHEQKDTIIQAVIEAVLLGTYVWDKHLTKSKNDKTIKDKKITLVAPKKKTYDDCEITCNGTNLARDLINDNADTITSDYLEKVIKKLIQNKKNITAEILNERQLKQKGLNLHLAVNQGSKNEPKLIIVKYTGGSKNDKYTAFIGKGMTYDTGGLNLKPTGSIETMRLDMSGAAAVIGTLKNAIDLKLKKNVLFIVGLAENVTDARSYKPGDVIRGYAGKSVEVGNTDAEGRLVLADAISYTVKNYKPARIIDIATLTGACIVALGLDYTGLVTPDDRFSRAIVRASNETDDRVWRLPIYPELKDSVKSKIADICNLGSPKGAGGTITAAEFLHQFTEGTQWAHLDIAGTSFVDTSERMYFGHGATGAGVRLVTHFLKNN